MRHQRCRWVAQGHQLRMSNLGRDQFFFQGVGPTMGQQVDGDARAYNGPQSNYFEIYRSNGFPTPPTLKRAEICMHPQNQGGFHPGDQNACLCELILGDDVRAVPTGTRGCSGVVPSLPSGRATLPTKWPNSPSGHDVVSPQTSHKEVNKTTLRDCRSKESFAGFEVDAAVSRKGGGGPAVFSRRNARTGSQEKPRILSSQATAVAGTAHGMMKSSEEERVENGATAKAIHRRRQRPG